MPSASRLQQLIDAAFASEMRWDRAQEKVTEGVLRPSMPRIVDALERARRSLDAEVRSRAAMEPWVGRAEVIGASTIADYPVGLCHLIRDAVRVRLRDDPGWRAIVRRGVVVRDVFVILRGRYFQNAIQLGNLYVDVANDTVDPSKPWLDWAPIREVQFENVSEIARIAEVTASYHGCSVHPNTLFPALAPVVPLLSIRSNGCLDLVSASPTAFLKDLRTGLSGYRRWVESAFGGLAPLPEPQAEFLEASCPRAGAPGFPFEFRRCSQSELIHEAVSLAGHACDPGRHEAVTEVIDLLPRATRWLRALKAAVPGHPPS